MSQTELLTPAGRPAWGACVCAAGPHSASYLHRLLQLHPGRAAVLLSGRHLPHLVSKGRRRGCARAHSRPSFRADAGPHAFWRCKLARGVWSAHPIGCWFLCTWALVRAGLQWPRFHAAGRAGPQFAPLCGSSRGCSCCKRVRACVWGRGTARSRGQPGKAQMVSTPVGIVARPVELQGQKPGALFCLKQHFMNRL